MPYLKAKLSVLIRRPKNLVERAAMENIIQTPEGLMEIIIARSGIT